MTTTLPRPACPLGYPRDQLERILGDRLAAFHKWHVGQTGAICDGRDWNWTAKEYEPNECADNPHGMVVYASDVREFLAGRRPSDW
jgi:hypothetical protein